MSYGASATVERAVESPSETCEELVQVHGGHKERRISTELKSRGPRGAGAIIVSHKRKSYGECTRVMPLR